MLKGLLYTFVLIIVVIVGFSYLTPGPLLKSTSTMSAERIAFKTIDGLKIRGSLYIPVSAEPAPLVIVAHENNNTRAQYTFLVPLLVERGFAVLAYDARGFGKSQGEKTDYAHAAYDIVGAIEYLVKDRRLDATKIFGIGASMGANTVYVATALDPRLRFGLVLSPSEHAMTALAEINPTERPVHVTIVYTEEDSYSRPQQLFDYAAYPKELITYKGNRHGIDLLQGIKQEELLGLLLKLK